MEHRSCEFVSIHCTPDWFKHEKENHELGGDFWNTSISYSYILQTHFMKTMPRLEKEMKGGVGDQRDPLAAGSWNYLQYLLFTFHSSKWSKYEAVILLWEWF